MKKVIVTLLSAVLLAGAVDAETIRQRQRDQQWRIAGGIRSGELTPQETAKLERKEARLNREIRRDRTDGGGLTPQERHKITRQQNQLSRQIYREKHDNQGR